MAERKEITPADLDAAQKLITAAASDTTLTPARLYQQVTDIGEDIAIERVKLERKKVSDAGLTLKEAQRGYEYLQLNYPDAGEVLEYSRAQLDLARERAPLRDKVASGVQEIFIKARQKVEKMPMPTMPSAKQGLLTGLYAASLLAAGYTFHGSYESNKRLIGSHADDLKLVYPGVHLQVDLITREHTLIPAPEVVGYAKEQREFYNALRARDLGTENDLNNKMVLSLLYLWVAVAGGAASLMDKFDRDPAKKTPKVAMSPING